MRASLTWISALTAVSGIWLAVMENILRHPGYAGRTAIAAGIFLQGLATVLFLMWQGRSVFRAIVLAGAVAVAVLGASASIRILNAPHSEGFVLLIGAALIVQAMMALVVTGGARRGTTI